MRIQVILALIAAMLPLVFPGTASSQESDPNGGQMRDLMDRIMTANEMNQVGVLGTFHSAQVWFRDKDVDGDGLADFWTADVAGLYASSNVDGDEVQAIPKGMAESDASPAREYPSLGEIGTPRGDYLMQAIAVDANGNPISGQPDAEGEANYAVCSFPDVYGESGRKTFIMSADGVIYSKDTGGKPVEQWPAEELKASGWHKEERDKPAAAADRKDRPDVEENEKRIKMTLLANLPTVQDRWKESDVDGNGVKDYWTSDVAGLYGLEVDGKAAEQLLPWIASADTSPSADYDGLEKLGTPYKGYYLQVIQLDANGDPYCQDADGDGKSVTNQHDFAVCAYPAEYGVTGRKTFIVNASRDVFSRNNEGKPVEQWPDEDPTGAGWKKEGVR